MTKLTVIMIDGQAILDVASDTLVYDGSNFVQPNRAKWVMLYSVPVTAVAQAFKDFPASFITVAGYLKTQVIAVDAAIAPVTDPHVVSANDPSLGQCICFITCDGTWMSFVKVYNI